MRRIVFVISDLHLGGDHTFRICGSQGQRLLAEFLESVRKLAEAPTADQIHLVVNGDSVDFLSEPKFAAMTITDSEAATKLKSIFDSTKAVWDGFRNAVRTGVRVRFLLGNHDLELSLPEPRRMLLERLGPGDVEFIYDNQAFFIGELLIEHGNQYDRWNKVDHDGLRQLRAAISRGQQPGTFKPPPGSKLVIDVMNDLKRDLHFVNLLKPEMQMAIPILGVLRPGAIRKIRSLVPLKVDAMGVKTSAIAGSLNEADSSVDLGDAAALRTAEVLAFGETSSQVAGALFATFQEEWRARKGREERRLQVELIRRALHYWTGDNLTAFDTQHEDSEYLLAATQSVQTRFSVVTYGHTHLAKRIPLMNGTAKYLNSGTWADLMAVPTALLLAKEGEKAEELERFVDDLMENSLKAWSGPVPTYVRVEMDGDKVVDADVWIYRDAKPAERLPPGRLQVKAFPPDSWGGSSV